MVSSYPLVGFVKAKVQHASKAWQVRNGLHGYFPATMAAANCARSDDDDPADLLCQGVRIVTQEPYGTYFGFEGLAIIDSLGPSRDATSTMYLHRCIRTPSAEEIRTPLGKGPIEYSPLRS
ncbi:hypothetical protein PSPO01_14827 [Paraphaeosphaeria sporulosa]